MSKSATRSMIPISSRAEIPRIAIALDFDKASEALQLIKRLKKYKLIYKIGLQLIYSDGLKLTKRLIASGEDVFLDAKLFDTPSTIERTATAISDFAPNFLTVVAQPSAIHSAKKALQLTSNHKTKILAVTILTSISDNHLKQWGYNQKLDDLVVLRARLAVEAGADGLICSPRELRRLREIFPKTLLVCPGIRMAGDRLYDQKRVATPFASYENGADILVIGRPITKSNDPALAIEKIINSFSQDTSKEIKS